MRPPSSEYAAPPVYLYPEPPKRGIRFSRTELVQLMIAVLALSGAMTLLFVRFQLFDRAVSGVLLGIAFATSLVAVSTGVGLHEIAHKAVAQRYGHWAEFRYNPMGLLLAFVFAFLGFIYGAPGATWISGSVTHEQNGRISAAGPATNIVLGTVFLGATAAVLGLGSGGLAAFVVVLILSFSAFINLVLAGFNMIPIMPLDGAKVWSWNKGAYFGILTLVVALFIAGYLADLFVVGF